jgi:hypothetical protein
MDISSLNIFETAKRNCFAKCFFKTVSAFPQNLLHQHNHSRNPTKPTLHLQYLT